MYWLVRERTPESAIGCLQVWDTWATLPMVAGMVHAPEPVDHIHVADENTVNDAFAVYAACVGGAELEVAEDGT